MTKLELFEKITEQKIHISNKIIELNTKEMFKNLTISLVSVKKIEIRRFGSFSLYYRSSHICHNPKNRRSVKLNKKYIPYFGSEKNYEIKKKYKNNIF